MSTRKLPGRHATKASTHSKPTPPNLWLSEQQPTATHLEGLHGLRRVLARGAAHQRKAGEGHHAVDKGAARAQGVVEELLDGGGEVEAACSVGWW